MDELNGLLNLGVDVNLGLIVMIVIVSSKVLQFLKKRNKGNKGSVNYRAIVPPLVGMVLVMLYLLLTQDTIVKSDVWVALVHSTIATGSYASVKSFLKKKGMEV